MLSSESRIDTWFQNIADGICNFKQVMRTWVRFLCRIPDACSPSSVIRRRRDGEACIPNSATNLNRSPSFIADDCHFCAPALTRTIHPEKEGNRMRSWFFIRLSA
ncbi:hypothetical protein HPP92_012826 [Vanilla planifolia]|uniref:Uncharacterized protein n=1 Tax=Vanilla planifolia TaxID=51239 RepID=A0A835QM94_VANPL|nr:hypothetical protein HPP92_012826 [Vanilla planifolia]